MDAQNEKSINKNLIYGIIRYISGVLGFFGIILAILTVTGAVGWFLIEIHYTKPYTEDTKLTLSLTSSILGIFFLFIAFSKQIDQFFSYLESHRIKTTKKEDVAGVTIESIFFTVIALVLIVLALLLATGTLLLKTDLPILGTATKTVLIVSLILLALLAILTAFNKTIIQSVKEMKKVHWPTGTEMLDYCNKVFFFIIFFALFFLILDLIYTNVPKRIEHLFGIDL